MKSIFSAGCKFLLDLLHEIDRVEREGGPSTDETSHELEDGRTIHVIQCDEDTLVGVTWGNTLTVVEAQPGIN